MSRGLALYASLKKHCAEFQFDVLCLDETCKSALEALSLPECRLISLAELENGDPDLPKIKDQRTTIEYYFTLTPCFINYSLKDVPAGEVLTYLDSDLFFFSAPDPVFEELGDASIGIIAHRFSPELEHMSVYGVYNVGWVSFRNDDRARNCLSWWRESCLAWCHDKVDQGRYADQGYLNDWPSRFAGIVSIQHLGANVAPWNVGQYKISGNGASVMVGKQPLVFYHFHALHKVTDRIFDSRLSKYGVDVTEELRRSIYQPYLDELFKIDTRLHDLDPVVAASSESSVQHIASFELVPRALDSRADPLQVAQVEDYLYRELVLVKKECLWRERAGIQIQRERERELADARSPIAELCSKLSEMRSELNDCHEELKGCRSELNWCRVELQESQLRRENTFAKLIDRSAELDGVRSDLADRGAELQSVRSKLQAAGAELHMTRKCNRFLRREPLFKFLSRNLRLHWRVWRRRTAAVHGKRRAERIGVG